MDRRSFLGSIILTPLLSHFLNADERQPSTLSLHLISDFPHDFLPQILYDLRERGINFGRRVWFPENTPYRMQLEKSFSANGWEVAKNTSTASFILNHNLLSRESLPSFSLVEKGRVKDIRSGKLIHLWKEMVKRNPSSSLLTTATLKKGFPSLSSGEEATVFFMGRKRAILSLKIDKIYLFRHKQHEICVKIEKRKAWVESSSCSQKICCHTPPASLEGERIICAPNHFILEINPSPSIDTSVG